jgi:hypothetical protein
VGNGTQLILKNGFRVVQQASDERALPIVYTTGGNEAQQLGMIKRNTFNS